ncbi:hypothetical protein Q9R20_07970 [Microbacterium sp. PRF11]|uniref:hypothetical protein n=1 Tax=Microbacterium sp. PRF11 TaxID=2962593 RepID=UPI002881C4B5|nr:hypothetical protein [Microbacterium sp. PRF11]MDT0116926.1 hypothetical protein [Microbacterium sp. PRF11]
MSPRHTSTAALAALLAAVACAASGCASSASAPPADTASIAERAAQLGVDPGLVFTTSVEGYDLAPQSVSPVDDAGLTATWFDESTSAMISIRTSPGAPTAESCAAMPLWDAPGEAVTCTEESGLWHREGGGTHEFLAERDDATILVLGGNGAPVDDLRAAAEAVRVPSKADLERLFADAPTDRQTPVERGDLPSHGDGAPIQPTGPGG